MFNIPEKNNYKQQKDWKDRRNTGFRVASHGYDTRRILFELHTHLRTYLSTYLTIFLIFFSLFFQNIDDSWDFDQFECLLVCGSQFPSSHRPEPLHNQYGIQ